MRVWNYIVIMLGLMIILQLAGFGTTSTQIFGLIGLVFSSSGIASFNLSASNFFGALFGSTGMLIGVGAGAVIAGLFTRSKPENLILLPLITVTLVLFVQTTNEIMTTMINLGDSWAVAVMAVFLIPFAVGFVLALGEFFRGTD